MAISGNQMMMQVIAAAFIIAYPTRSGHYMLKVVISIIVRCACWAQLRIGR